MKGGRPLHRKVCETHSKALDICTAVVEIHIYINIYIYIYIYYNIRYLHTHGYGYELWAPSV